MDFTFQDSLSQNYLHRVHLTEEETDKIFYNKLGFIYLEIPKFNLEENMLTTGLERWMYVLKNMSSLQKIPLILNKKIFEKLFHIAAASNLSKEEYMNYEKDLMNYWDEYVFLKSKDNAFKEGIQKGMEEGVQKGMQKGTELTKTQFVKNLLSANKFSISEIANFANVTEPFVRKVKKELK